MTPPTVRVGLPETTGTLPLAAADLSVPVLVSASRLWDARRQQFRAPGANIEGLDVALDSAGFTVMKSWGGCYPWKLSQYITLGLSYPWAWYSQPDFCVEPEIAGDPGAVAHRIDKSAHMLREARLEVLRLAALACVMEIRLRGDFADHSLIHPCIDRERRYPMPVLQGWEARDYTRSILAVDTVLGGQWPALVGVGSMCRRNIHGDRGILAVLDVLDHELPVGVRLHLFGVKGGALRHLAPYAHRVESVDSMAWDYAARRQRDDKPEHMRPIDWRAQKMGEWSAVQGEHQAALGVELAEQRAATQRTLARSFAAFYANQRAERKLRAETDDPKRLDALLKQTDAARWQQTLDALTDTQVDALLAQAQAEQERLLAEAGVTPTEER